MVCNNTKFVCKQRAGSNISIEVTDINDINTRCDFSPFVLTIKETNCTDPPIASYSASLTVPATLSAQIYPNASTSASIQGFVWLVFVAFAILIFIQSIFLGTWFFKR